MSRYGLIVVARSGSFGRAEIMVSICSAVMSGRTTPASRAVDECAEAGFHRRAGGGDRRGVVCKALGDAHAHASVLRCTPVVACTASSTSGPTENGCCRRASGPAATCLECSVSEGERKEDRYSLISSFLLVLEHDSQLFLFRSLRPPFRTRP